MDCIKLRSSLINAIPQANNVIVVSLIALSGLSYSCLVKNELVSGGKFMNTECRASLPLQYTELDRTESSSILTPFIIADESTSVCNHYDTRIVLIQLLYVYTGMCRWLLEFISPP